MSASLLYVKMLGSSLRSLRLRATSGPLGSRTRRVPWTYPAGTSADGFRNCLAPPSVPLIEGVAEARLTALALGARFAVDLLLAFCFFIWSAPCVRPRAIA